VKDSRPTPTGRHAKSRGRARRSRHGVADRTKAGDGADGEDTGEPKLRNWQRPGAPAALPTGVEDIDGRGLNRAPGGRPLDTRMPIVRPNARPGVVDAGPGGGSPGCRRQVAPKTGLVSPAEGRSHGSLGSRKGCRPTPPTWIRTHQDADCAWHRIWFRPDNRLQISPVRRQCRPFCVMRPLHVQHTSLTAPQTAPRPASSQLSWPLGWWRRRLW